MGNYRTQEEPNILRTSFPLFSASFVAQGINFLLLFLLPHLFPVEEISMFFVFSALGNILIPLVSLQSQNAVVLSHSSAIALQRLGVSLLISAALSFLVFLLALGLKMTPLETILDNFSGVLPLVAVYCLLGSSLIGLEHYFTFRKWFKVMGLIKLLKSVSIFVLTLLAGFLNLGSSSLILAFLAGHLLVVLFIWIRGFVPLNQLRIRRHNFEKFIIQFRELLAFETTFSGFSQSISHLPVILLSIFYGEKVVAFYGIAHRVFATPLNIWSQSVTQVFYKRISDYYNATAGFYEFAKSAFRKVFWVALAYGLVSGVLAPLMLQWIMGEDWASAGIIARIIIPLLVIQNAAMPLTAIFTVLRTQRLMLPYFAVGFFFRILLGFIVPYYMFGATYITVLFMFTLTGIIYYIFFIRKLLQDVNSYEAGL
ncbi:MAG: oligosaccharide flippase family protein [Marinilabilia sp.]